ncbi:MAG: tRNA (N6-threonylcarbamoyladenosine(37)-N6)-methyltransferase TrmO [Atribacterota bacterium]
MKEIKYKPIGVIHSPFKKPHGTPIQPVGGKDVGGTVEVFEEYKKGLKDIEGFSHIILLFHLHLAKKYKLQAIPFMDNVKRGIFAIRGPSRPNPIGLSVVRLIKVKDNVLQVKDLDILDNTPLLDIKPYIPKIDAKKNTKVGWLKNKDKRFSSKRADRRFSDK